LFYETDSEQGELKKVRRVGERKQNKYKIKHKNYFMWRGRMMQKHNVRVYHCASKLHYKIIVAVKEFHNRVSIKLGL
jgi:hypothetical protein